MVKHIKAIRLQQLATCLSGFDHFVRLELKGFKSLAIGIFLHALKIHFLINFNPLVPDFH